MTDLGAGPQGELALAVDAVEALAVLTDAVAAVRRLLPREVTARTLHLYKDFAEALDADAVAPLRDMVTQLREGCADAVPVRRVIEDDGTERWESTPVESGGRRWRRTGKASRSGFDKDRCRLDVLDSVRIYRRPAVDKTTGEILTDENGDRRWVEEVIPETPTEKLLHVFPLGDPRKTALEERRLDIDDYCTTSWGARDVKEIPEEPAKETP